MPWACVAFTDPGVARRAVGVLLSSALKVRVAIGTALPGVFNSGDPRRLVGLSLCRRHSRSPTTLRGETPSPPAPLFTRRSVGQTAGRALLVVVKSLQNPGAIGVRVFAVSVEATGGVRDALGGDGDVGAGLRASAQWAPDLPQPARPF